MTQATKQSWRPSTRTPEFASTITLGIASKERRGAGLPIMKRYAKTGNRNVMKQEAIVEVRSALQKDTQGSACSTFLAGADSEASASCIMQSRSQLSFP